MTLTTGQVLRNRYRIVSLLAQGRMGAVYRAWDLSLNIPVALKELVPEPGIDPATLAQLRAQFQGEAQVLAKLVHPNLPRVTDYFEWGGNAYLVMDFVEGEDLDTLIARQGPLPEAWVVNWAGQLLDALAACHARHIVHRDVKPHNIIIHPDGRAVLVDFGLVKLWDLNDPRTRTAMRAVGRSGYAPPEQYDAKKRYTDARTDIYSLAATLYHALTGEAPPTVTEQVVNPKSLVPPRQYRDDLSEVTERVLMKAMALQPPQRFQNVAEMYKALFDSPLSKVKAESTAFSEGGTGMLVKPPTATILLPWMGTAKRRIDRRIWVAIAAVAIMSLVTIVLVMDGISAGNVPTATATSTVTVTMAPTHTPTVTLSSTATSTASPASRPPTRQPTETPDEFSPTPTPTPTFMPPPTTPTPTPLPTLMIEAEWPERMEIDRSDYIRVSLVRTTGGEYVPTVEVIGHTVVAATPVPVGTPEAPVERAFGPAYKASAVARLKGEAFEISLLETEYQSLDQDRITWDWNILPSMSGPQIINACIIVQWEPTEGEGSTIERTIWRAPLEIVVKKPLVKTDQLSILSLVSGLLGSVLSAPWLYERIKEAREKRREEEESKPKIHIARR